MFRRLLFLVAALGVPFFAIAGESASMHPTAILTAVADTHRPLEQTQLDAQRKPAQLINFAGVKPGDRIADFMPGNA